MLAATTTLDLVNNILVVAVPIILTAGVGFLFRKKIQNSNAEVRDSVNAIHEEVRTNHGLKASEYLEMIAQVKTDQEFVKAQLGSIVRLAADTHTQVGLVSERVRSVDSRVATLCGRVEAVERIVTASPAIQERSETI